MDRRGGFAWTREAIRLNCFLSLPEEKQGTRDEVSGRREGERGRGKDGERQRWQSD